MADIWPGAKVSRRSWDQSVLYIVQGETETEMDTYEEGEENDNSAER